MIFIANIWDFNANEMKKTTNKRITIKIGSNVMTTKEGGVDLLRIEALAGQIAELRNRGVEVILVSSGAVAFGKNELKLNKKLDSVSSRQLFSAIGQVKLMNTYYDLFKKMNITCGQVLTSKENFGSRKHYLNQKHCMDVMLENNILPIVNENDTTSVTELMFTDNDELSGLIATMMGCDSLIILSNIDGIYNGNPNEPGTCVIREISSSNKKTIAGYVQTSKSSFGRGGMLTKCSISQKVADEGIEVIIANGKRDNILLRLFDNKENEVCTRFLPNKRGTSTVKKWIAHSEGFAKGEIVINEGAKEALLNSEAISILMVGVSKILGDFEKDDIVRIIDEGGNLLGVGKTQYSSKEAVTLIGAKKKKPIIHYDYLYLE